VSAAAEEQMDKNNAASHLGGQDSRKVGTAHSPVLVSPGIKQEGTLEHVA